MSFLLVLAESGTHIKHSFVMKRNSTDSWIPAIRENERREQLQPDLVEELQSRELSNNDYDLLLQLDQIEKFPIQDYLLSKLGGQKVTAENVKTFGEAGGICTICRQSLRIHADVRSAICGVSFCMQVSIFCIRDECQLTC